jgi:sugar phosphate permease
MVTPTLQTLFLALKFLNLVRGCGDSTGLGEVEQPRQAEDHQPQEDQAQRTAFHQLLSSEPAES